MMLSRLPLGLAPAGLALLLAAQAPAQDLFGTGAPGPIAALSEAEIAGFEAGEGMGLALAAEMNGYPGPRHVLDLAEQLELSDTQRAQIQRIFDRTQAEAQRIGRAYLEAEAALDATFAGGRADPAAVVQGIERSAGLRAELQAVHLLAHLETAPILDEAQLAEYAALRGHDGGSDGGAEPEAHHEGGDVEH